MTPQERQELIADIVAAIKDAEPKLCSEELMWVKNAIQIQNDRKKRDKAIIEKTLAGLLWMFIAGVGMVFYEFIKNHGYRP